MLVELTRREWDVVRELCRDGADTSTISLRLTMRPDTVKSHVRNVLRKMHLNSRTELITAVWHNSVHLACKVPTRSK